jgi:hypothetical protein
MVYKVLGGDIVKIGEICLCKSRSVKNALSRLTHSGEDAGFGRSEYVPCARLEVDMTRRCCVALI